MQLKKIANLIKENGGNLYMVGGAVRDTLLGKQPKDFDFCVTNMSLEKFTMLFPNAILRGKSFGVFDIDGFEFALARRERKIEKGHKGFLVENDENISIYEDLKRRDVTINSIAIDVLTGEIIDPFNGILDLENKILKATSEAFLEDPLRVYRVSKLAARYNFSVDENTIDMMKSLKIELSTLSPERVFKEFYDALSTNKPSIFFDTLRISNCLDVHFKEVYDLINVPQPILYHPEGDVYNHTMEVLDRASLKTENVLIRFAALVHDFGKAKTKKEDLPHHYDHDKLGVEVVNKFCKRLKLPNDFRACGIVSSSMHMKASLFNEMRFSKKVDFLVNNYRTKLGLYGLEIVVNADKVRENEIKFAKIGEEMIKKINGKELKDKLDYNKLKEEVRRRRIEYLKENLNGL